jgi:hypothetical protein
MVTGGYGLVGYGIQAVVNSGSGDEWAKKDDEVKCDCNFSNRMFRNRITSIKY